jgi:protein-tyrosine phosphatase
MTYDFSRVTERLFVGAQINTQSDVDELVAAGVTHLIDAEIEHNDATIQLIRPMPFNYLWNPTADDGQPKPQQWFQKALDAAMPAMSQPGKIVLTHCAAGVNRGPSLAFAILRAQGLNHDQAIVLLNSARPVTIPGVRYAGDADKALAALGWSK